MLGDHIPSFNFVIEFALAAKVLPSVAFSIPLFCDLPPLKIDCQSSEYIILSNPLYTTVYLLFMCSCIDLNYGCESLQGICLLCACSIENSSVSDKVLQAVEEALQKFPFSYQGARILSGQEEGAFGWVTVNYLDDRLKQVSAMSACMSMQVCPLLDVLSVCQTGTCICQCPPAVY